MPGQLQRPPQAAPPLGQAASRRSRRAAIDFGHAEALAFASLLTEGVHIRLTGQDTERGTFSHRHLVLHDENTGLKYTPMQNLRDAKAPFELHNSPLSEIACLGFEYGYSAATPSALVLWEAQFGDFANAAQVIIDSFIVSGEAKWGQTSRLTLLLPHGYEGSGPEHSSARIERFLALGAEGNIRIANPTTAAQYFHLLRRQALIRKPRPLIVFTPEGPAAARPRRLDARGPDRGRVPLHPRRPEGRRAPREGRAPRPLHRQDLLRHRRPRAPRDRRERRDRPGRAALPVRQGTARRADRRLPEPEGDRLGPGGAAQHGRLEGDVAPPPRRRCPRASTSPTSAAPAAPARARATPAAHALEQERIVLTALTPGSSWTARCAARVQAVREARPRAALRLGQAPLLGRAGDLHRR